MYAELHPVIRDLNSWTLTDESDFIKSLLNQKEKAFKKLLDLYQKRLYWHIRKMVITHENANDVLQNTFLRIYKSLPGFKQNSSLNTWMFRIAYNESLRFIEQEKKKTHSSIDDLSKAYMNNLVADTFFLFTLSRCYLLHYESMLFFIFRSSTLWWIVKQTL